MADRSGEMELFARAVAVGSFSSAARVLGKYDHSGATPRKYRHDAAIALAELAYRLDEEWARLDAQGREMVCTFCVLATTAEAGFTKIPGEAEFQLDIRSVEMANCDALMAALPLDPLAARVGFTMAIWLGLAGALFLLFADDAAVLLLFAAGLSALAALVLGGGLAGWLPLAFGDLALTLPMAALALVPALGWLYARALKRRGVLH